MQNRTFPSLLHAEAPSRSLNRRSFEAPNNELLSALPPEDYFWLLGDMDQVLLRQGQVLSRPGLAAEYTFFPEQALIFMVNDFADGRSAEVGAIGKRGLLGVSIALATATSFQRAVVEVPGTALRMKADRFIAEFEHRPSFRRIVLDYAWRKLLMTEQYVVCNRVHTLKQRLARLLLTLHDHFGCKEFPMTHQFMEQMLGSHRSEVDKSATRFHHAGFIQFERGKVRIVTREGLESEGCECYQTAARALRD
jgi:CRP-like cAMP-binding protein